MIMVTATTTVTSAAPSAATLTVVVAHDAAAGADVRPVEDIDAEFFALIYSDPELLRDEFEELVVAAWSGRPPPTAEPGRGSGPPDRSTVVPAFAGGGRPAGPVAGARDRGARPRSPPKSTTRSSLPDRWQPKEESRPRRPLLGWLAPPYPSAHSSA